MISPNNNMFQQLFSKLDNQEALPDLDTHQTIMCYLKCCEKHYDQLFFNPNNKARSIPEAEQAGEQKTKRVEWKELQEKIRLEIEDEEKKEDEEIVNRGLGDDIAKELATVDKNFHSVVLIVEKDSLGEPNSGGYYTIEKEILCKRELRAGGSLTNKIPFANQPSIPSVGTGFFVKNSVIATAAHILFPYQNSLNKLAFIRNVHYNKGGKLNSGLADNGDIRIHKDDVFYINETHSLSARNCKYTLTNTDWALVPVNTEKRRPATVTISSQAIMPTIFREVYCIGHGLGLPKKMTLEAFVIKNDLSRDFFETKLEVFSGNSGSPVFFSDSHELAGILVRGSAALIDTSNDQYQLYPTGNEEEGEECQRVSSEFNEAISEFQ